MPSPPPKAAGETRYVELDSLRGIAALTVVFHHFRLMWFGLGWGAGHRWLHLFDPLTAGHEGVVLFFLLSGFVLSMPNLRGKGQPYPAYLLRRILRIYAPYIFALALAVAGAAVWHGSLGHGPWAAMTWNMPVHLPLVLQHVLMIGPYNSSEYNTAFWSLIVEMRVSLIFPFLFALTRRLWLGVALLLAMFLAFAGEDISMHRTWLTEPMFTVTFTGAFIVGIVLAIHLQRLRTWFQRRSFPFQMFFAMSSFVLFTWGARLAEFLPRFVGLDLWLIGTGAAGYILLAMESVPVRQLLQTAPARFLGRISYSLYLVHGTVLFALTEALRGRGGLFGDLVLYVPISLLLAYLFCLAFEEPFLRLSRLIGKRTQTVLQQQPVGPITLV